LSIQCGRST